MQALRGLMFVKIVVHSGVGRAFSCKRDDCCNGTARPKPANRADKTVGNLIDRWAVVVRAACDDGNRGATNDGL
jgi:hypothetical protein